MPIEQLVAQATLYGDIMHTELTSAWQVREVQVQSSLVLTGATCVEQRSSAAGLVKKSVLCSVGRC